MIRVPTSARDVRPSRTSAARLVAFACALAFPLTAARAQIDAAPTPLPRDARAACRELRELRTNGRPDEAIALAERLPTALRDDTRVAGELAQSLLLEGRTVDAIDEVKRFADVDPVAFPLAVARAQVLRLAGRADDALTVADAGLAAMPGNVGWTAVRVAALCDLGRFAEARETVASLETNCTASTHTRLHVDVELAHARRLASDPDMLERVVPMLEDALSRDATRTDVRLELVQALVRWHREDRAEELAREPLGELRGSRLADMLFALGVVQRARLEIDASIESFERSLEVRPERTSAHVAIARSLLKRGDRDAAAARIGQALADAPDHPEALTVAAEIELGRGRPAEAARALETLLQQRPDDTQALYLLARARSLMGDAEDARACLARRAALFASR